MVSPVAIGKACAKPTALPLPPVDAVQVLTFRTLHSPCASFPSAWTQGGEYVNNGGFVGWMFLGFVR